MARGQNQVARYGDHNIYHYLTEVVAAERPPDRLRRYMVSYCFRVRAPTGDLHVIHPAHIRLAFIAVFLLSADCAYVLVEVDDHAVVHRQVSIGTRKGGFTFDVSVVVRC